MIQSHPSKDEPIRAVDLFCGAGGLSTALAIACEILDVGIELVAVNHWNRAVETHEMNHPWSRTYQSTIEDIDPDSVFDDEVPVDLLVGGPECTHFSTARGGAPVNDQKRMPAWHVLTWVQKLQPTMFLFENVPEFKLWGPVNANGRPSKNGEVFDSWITALRGHGYYVDYQVLNSADYGDATARNRLFIIGHREHPPTYPEPTHSEDGETPETEPWRQAREVIDWSDTGQSVWTRGMNDNKRPLVENTMRRIAEGLRRHTCEELVAYANVVESLEPERLRQMQKVSIPIEQATELAKVTDEPFLVKYGEADMSLCQPFLLRQQSGGVPPSTEMPMPTISTKGAIAKIEPYLVQYYGQSGSKRIDEPLPTVTTKGRFALISPKLFPFGIDLHYRMLQPRELAQAMGFPADYQFAGNKTETIKQIGNAVPVNVGASLCQHLLEEAELDVGPVEITADGGKEPEEDK